MAYKRCIKYACKRFPNHYKNIIEDINNTYKFNNNKSGTSILDTIHLRICKILI